VNVAGIASEVVQNRNLEIVNRFYDEGRSYSWLSNEYGLAEITIRKMVARDVLNNGARERVAHVQPTCRLADKPLSYAHAMLGNKVSEYIERNKLGPTTFGAPVKLSRHKVRALMRGVYDPSMSELQKLSKVLGITLAEFFSSKEITVAG
jgi:hypothetical protein